MKTSIGFSLYLNGKLVREVTFDRPIVNVGKLSTSNLRLDDINVSRKHAVVEQRENGLWRITDLGSTNGTIVRGERVLQGDLHDGDRLVLGTTTLVVHLDEGDAAKKRKQAHLEVTSGVAGAVRKPKRPAGRAGESVKSGEIRGLGEDSFLKRRGIPEVGKEVSNTLEVALLWGETVLAVERFDSAQSVFVGEEQGCRFTVPREILGAGRYELIQSMNGKFVLNLSSEAFKGEVLAGDKVRDVSEVRAEGKNTLTFDDPARARLKIGEFTLLVTFGPTPVKGAIPTLGDVEIDPWIYITVSAIVHIAFLVSLSFMPLDLDSLTERDPREARERAIEALMVEPEEEEEEIEPPDTEDEEIEKVVSEDGVKKDLKATNQEVELEAKDVRPQLIEELAKRRKTKKDFDSMSESDKRDTARELVQQTALNKAMEQNNPLLTEVLNTNPDMTNKPTFKALASTNPNAAADVATSLDIFGGGTLAPGAGGLQTVGGPAGPGGPGGGPVIAGIGRPNGRNGRDPSFTNRDLIPKIIQMKPRLVGELDAKTVQAYIRRFLKGIKWCYQDRLQLKRKLGGKLTLAFTILPNGRTANPRTLNSSLGDAPLEACIRKKMSRWKFPSPKDGGVVEVQYPLILKTQ